MSVLYVLAGIRTGFGNILCQFITYFGQEAICLLLVCYMFWCVDKKVGYRMSFAFFLSSTIAQGLKLIFRIERPWVIDPAFKPVESALDGASGYSFPSGHTQTATSIFGVMALESRRKWAKVLCILLFAAVGFSRMYLGVHQPKDVVVGFLIAAAVIVLIYGVKPLEHKKWDLSVTLFLLVLALCLLGYDQYLFANGLIDASMAADATKNAGGLCGFALGYFLERKYVDFENTEDKKKRLIRFVLGGMVTGILYIGLKVLFHALSFGMPGDFFRYFVLMLWVVVLYPALFVKFKL